MRAGSQRSGIVRPLLVLVAVLAASLSSLSPSAGAQGEPETDASPAADNEAVGNGSAIPVVVDTTEDELNVRSGPGLDQPVVGTVADGSTVDVTCQTQPGSEDNWYSLNDGTYILATFTQPTDGSIATCDAPEPEAVSPTDAVVPAAPSNEGATADEQADLAPAATDDPPVLGSATSGASESVHFVVDTSGSMYGTRLEQAKGALRQGITVLADSQAAGLRHYPSSGCDGGRLLVPIAVDNRAAMQTAVDGLVAGGSTPTGPALRAAVADLPPSGSRTIVLVSDGEANCGEDPCLAAKDLVASAGVKFTVQAVGFNVSGAAPAQLQCIADATGGRYFEATDSAGLAEAIKGAIGGDDIFKYVALGDSYSAGEGVDPYFRDGRDMNGNQPGNIDNRCHRSTTAYSTQVGYYYEVASGGGDPGNGKRLNKYGSDQNIREQNDVAWTFLACSGATTDNVRIDGVAQNRAAGYRDSLPQLSHPSVDSDTDLVTITIGGNDVEFAKVLSNCARLPNCDTRGYVRDVFARIENLHPTLVKVYEQILATTNGADVLVLGYPQLFPTGIDRQTCLELAPFLGEQAFLREANVRLNDVIKRAAGEAGVIYLSVNEKFKDHEVCGRKGSWLNGPDLTFKCVRSLTQFLLRNGFCSVKFLDDESFHPTRIGHQKYAEVINEYLTSPNRR